MGLAPQLVEEIFEIVGRLNREQNLSVLVAEQNTNIALRYARYGYILESGRVVLDGDAPSLKSNEDVKEFYLGVSSGERRSFRDVKHYRRRKRWLAYNILIAGKPVTWNLTAFRNGTGPGTSGKLSTCTQILIYEGVRPIAARLQGQS